MGARAPAPNIGPAASTAAPTSAGSSSPGKRWRRGRSSSRNRGKCRRGWPNSPPPDFRGRGTGRSAVEGLLLEGQKSPSTAFHAVPLPSKSRGGDRRPRLDSSAPSRHARAMILAPLLLALAAPSAPLLTPAETRAIAEQVSGSAAKRTVQALSLHHRMRGSDGYRAAAELIRDRLREYGLEEVDILSLPADGNIFYGTQRSRPAWNARFAELWEESRDAAGRWADSERVASWAD